MEFKVNPKEKLYFTVKVLATIAALAGIAGVIATTVVFAKGEFAKLIAIGAVWLIYIGMFVVYFKFIHFLMIGYLRGNGVKITETQFPEVYKMIQEIAEAYNMKKIPEVFLTQSGGVLNAYATRFVGRDYVAIYAEIFSLIENDPEVLKFVLAHEMAHIKRKHLQKRTWTLLSFYVPFLSSAYSRSCEHTCDSFANEISKEGAVKGLILLAAGKELYKKIDVDQYLAEYRKQNSITVAVAEKFFSHPNLPKRIKYIQG